MFNGALAYQNVDWAFALGLVMAVIFAEVGILLWDAVSLWWANREVNHEKAR